MSFHVQGKVVTPCKTALAHFAFERLCTRVLPIMPGQLVRPEGKAGSKTISVSRWQLIPTWQIDCYTLATGRCTAFPLRKDLQSEIFAHHQSPWLSPWCTRNAPTDILVLPIKFSQIARKGSEPLVKNTHVTLSHQSQSRCIFHHSIRLFSAPPSFLLW